MQTKRTPGIRERHSRSCKSREGGRCNCDPSIEAFVYDARESRRLGRVVKIRKTFSGPGALAAAKAWRRDAAPEVARGKMQQTPRQRLDEAVDEWLAKCETGEVLSRRKTTFAASTLRDYRSDLDRYVLPALGHRPFRDIAADDVQAIIERMNGEGLAGQTVRNAIVALQSFYRYHRRRVPIDPTLDLDLPEPGQRRERAATPAEAAALLSALEGLAHDVYACAFYSGLRRGELRALRVEDVPLDDGYLYVQRSWDDVTGEKETKSKAGTRQVPILSRLRPILEARTEGRPGSAFVFGSDDAPFVPNTTRRHAEKGWAVAAVGAFLTRTAFPDVPIGLHEARHSYSTWLDATGVSETRADRYMGHANASVQARYRHLLPGQLAEDAVRIDAYLDGATSGKVVALPVAAID